MRGFTLIETLITTAVLVTGLVAVATIFSYSAGANITTQQRTTATVLLYEKMEHFKSAPLTEGIWIAGGSLNSGIPTSGYYDYATIDSAGGVSTSTTDSSLPYLRVWQIGETAPRTITIAVSARKAGLTGRPMELVRATTMKGTSF